MQLRIQSLGYRIRRFRAYGLGSPDAFFKWRGLGATLWVSIPTPWNRALNLGIRDPKLQAPNPES